MRKSIPENVKRELFAKSGNQCEFRGCDVILFGENRNSSNICHIQGLEPGSARYNPNLSSDEVNSINNLMLCCPNHHKMIDDGGYTVSQLIDMKNEHEQKIYNLLNNNIIKREYLKVLSKYNFDIIKDCFWKVPYKLSIIDELGCCAEELRNMGRQRQLKNEGVSSNGVDICDFASKIDYFIDSLSICTYPCDGNNVFGILGCDDEDRKKIDELWRIIYRDYCMLLK